MTPKEIMTEFPVRKYKAQKRKFRAAVLSYVRSMGYSAHVENGSFGAKNLIIGNPDTAEILVTAHYDTCGLLPGLSAVTPCSLTGVVLFLFVRTLLLLIIPAILAAIMLFFHLLWVEISVFSAALILTVILLVVFRINPYATENDSSGVLALLEIAAGVQKLHRSKVCFVLFDLGHCGYAGARSYVKAHRQAAERQKCICLRDVGRGDQIYIFPGKKEKAKNMLDFLPFCGFYGKKQISLRTKGFYLSDQIYFPSGAVICAAKRKFKFLFLRTADRKQTVNLDETNVNLLRAAILSMISRPAVQ